MYQCRANRARRSFYDQTGAQVNDDILQTFIKQYVEDNGINSNYEWNRENKNTLVARTLFYKGFPSLNTLISQIQKYVSNTKSDNNSLNSKNEA